jgi:hypothetical protein
VLQVEEEARRARAGAGKPAACVAARVAAARRGGAGRSQRRPASGGRGRWRARGAERSSVGAAGLVKWPAKVARSRARAEQGEGLEVEDRDLSTIFQKMQGLHCKAKLTFKP